NVVDDEPLTKHEYADAMAEAVGASPWIRSRGLLRPLAEVTERRTGLAAWAVLPVLIAGGSLIVAVWGYYWDVSIHIDQGRDSGAFGNPAHWFIIAGLDGIAFAGLLALFLGDDRSGSAVRLRDRWSVPVGGILLTLCGAVALAGFPLDDIWHRLFGQDVTAWGPTHIQMIAGASLSTIACWVLIVEAERIGTPTRAGRALLRFSDVALAGALLVGLSTLQVEFDYGVPQFRLLEHPVLITVAASIALVAARIRLGRGGALAAVAFFLALRGALTLGVAAFDRIDFHFPLYVGSAVVIELVALALKTDRTVRFGVAAGLGVATAGFLSEWAWNRARMPIEWTSDLFPEVIPFVLVAGLAGGALGGLAGRDLAGRSDPVPRGALALGWLGVVAAIGLALPMDAEAARSAEITVEPTGDGRAHLEVAMDPSDAGEDAAWFHVLTWQGSADGGPQGSAITELVRQEDGTYRTAEPVVIEGSAKTLIRFHRGDSLQSAPVYLPEDEAIPAEAVPAESGTERFVADKVVLQREARTDRAGLEKVAYAVLALIAAAWLATITWGLQRLGGRRRAKREPTTARSPLQVQPT
ncbi:MAG TPA: hypothetical protein VD926_15540, partial [Acidimicrobiales bacterium]|nr:hypothetical protein [Acidimicrobiales bacterium]